MPEQQPDAVTELAERIYAEIPGGTYPNQVRVWLAGLAARAVFDSGLVVPRAELAALRRAVLDLAAEWVDSSRSPVASTLHGVVLRDCAVELRALAGDESANSASGSWLDRIAEASRRAAEAKFGTNLRRES